MNIEIVKDDKHECEIKLTNLTTAEVLRAYLYEAGADFAAWRREHPSQPVLLKIQSADKPIKKVVSDAIAAIKRDCDKILAVVKK